MKQRLNGQEVDILGGDEFKASQLQLIEAINRRNKRPAIRQLDTLQGDAVGSAAVLTSDSPPPGRAWEIRRLVIAVGVNVKATLTTGLFVYRNTDSPASLVDFNITIPYVSVWSAEQLVIHPGDVLIASVVGTAGATDTVAFTLYGIDYNTVARSIDV